MFRSLLLLALFSLPCAADQLYVRNRPFKGATSQADGRLWVELKPLAEALGVQLASNAQGGYALARSPLAPDAASSVAAGKLQIGEALVDVQSADGSARVPLDDVARALGARVVPNRELHTIDVSLPVSNSQMVATAGPTAAPLPVGNTVRIHGRLMPGSNAVGLFDDGGSSTPYKLGTVDGKGNYVMDIDLDKDLHPFQRGKKIADMRFFRQGAFDRCHGRCNFVIKSGSKVELQVYGGPTYQVLNRDLEYSEKD